MQTVFKDDKEFETFKEWTHGLLRDQHVKDLCIVFTKKDGTDRAMHCTLVEAKIPVEKLPKTQEESGSQTSGSACRVYDTEKQEWRSFRWDSVKKVEFDL